jgi:hypothetical protein
MGIQSILEQHPGILAFLDDLTLADNEEALRNRLPALKAQLQQIGLELNMSKCVLFTRKELSKEAKAAWSEFGVTITHDGFKLLGAPIGSPDFVREELQKRSTDVDESLEALRQLTPTEPNSGTAQIKLALLRACIATKPLFTFRTVSQGDLTAELAEQIERALRTFILSEILDADIEKGIRNAAGWLKMHLPISLGGVGIPSPIIQQRVSLVASYLDVIRDGVKSDLLDTFSGDLATIAGISASAPAYATLPGFTQAWNNLPQEVREQIRHPSSGNNPHHHVAEHSAGSTLPAPSSERHWTEVMQRTYNQHLIQHVCDELEDNDQVLFTRAMFTSFNPNTIGKALVTLPQSQQMTLHDDALASTLRYLGNFPETAELSQALYPEGKCATSRKCAEDYKGTPIHNHAGTCMSSRSNLHNKIQNTLIVMMKKAGHKDARMARQMDLNALDKSQKCLDIVLNGVADQIDVTTDDPRLPSMVQATANNDIPGHGAAAKIAEDRKFVKYDNNVVRPEILVHAAGFEITGAMGPGAVEVIERFCVHPYTSLSGIAPKAARKILYRDIGLAIIQGFGSSVHLYESKAHAKIIPHHAISALIPQTLGLDILLE